MHISISPNSLYPLSSLVTPKTVFLNICSTNGTIYIFLPLIVNDVLKSSILQSSLFERPLIILWLSSMQEYPQAEQHLGSTSGRGTMATFSIKSTNSSILLTPSIDGRSLYP